jgi:hypothetical protein
MFPRYNQGLFAQPGQEAPVFKDTILAHHKLGGHIIVKFHTSKLNVPLPPRKGAAPDDSQICIIIHEGKALEIQGDSPAFSKRIANLLYYKQLQKSDFLQGPEKELRSSICGIFPKKKIYKNA